VVTELIHQSVDENARSVIDQTEYQHRYNGLVVRYEMDKDTLEQNEELLQARRVKREQLDAFISTLLLQGSFLTEFDVTFWFAVMDKVTAYASDDIQIAFSESTVIKP